MTAIERSTFYSRRIRKTRREIIVPVTQSIGNVVSFDERPIYLLYFQTRIVQPQFVRCSRMIRESNRVEFTNSSRKLCVSTCMSDVFPFFFFFPFTLIDLIERRSRSWNDDPSSRIVVSAPVQQSINDEIVRMFATRKDYYA